MKENGEDDAAAAVLVLFRSRMSDGERWVAGDDDGLEAKREACNKGEVRCRGSCGTRDYSEMKSG